VIEANDIKKHRLKHEFARVELAKGKAAFSPIAQGVLWGWVFQSDGRANMFVLPIQTSIGWML
jgi:hypothetical protein